MLFVRSGTGISFPGEYMEGYGYLQNMFYGGAKGKFYDEKDVQLWLPSRLLKPGSVELNYLTGRKGNILFIAFMNQSAARVVTTVELNDSLASFSGSSRARLYDQGKWQKTLAISGSSFPVEVGANGLTVIQLNGVDMKTGFQQQFLSAEAAPANDYKKVDLGNARAMLFRFGNYSAKTFVYLQDDDAVFSSVTMEYQLKDGTKKSVTDNNYPFEFTIDVPATDPAIEFSLKAIKRDGSTVKSHDVLLGNMGTGVAAKKVKN
jgi:hypothetical protein